MKLETLRKNNKNKILLGISFIFIILSIITLVTSRAKYIKTQSVTIVDNEIKFTPYDFKMMAMYKQKDDCSNKTSTECYAKMGDDERMPSTGYAINETLSYCATSVNGPKDNDARIYTNSDGEHIISNLQKESKCYLYFEKQSLSEKTFNTLAELGGLNDSDEVPDFRYTSSEADEGIEVCTFNGENVENYNGEYVTQEECQQVYRYDEMNEEGKIFYTRYYDSSIVDYYTYVGEGKWNAENSECTYNDMFVESASSEQQCGKVYEDSNGYYNVGMEITEVGAGDFGPIIGKTGIYKTEDDDGVSYYFRGDIQNNYVKFGKTNAEKWKKADSNVNFYSSQEECESVDTDTCIKLYGSNEDIWWRIIRINGDGSIRMIYAGTSINGVAPEQTGVGTVVGGEEFNISSNQAEYVGYQYTLSERNGHSEDSNVKEELDKWFEENLLDEYNATDSKIDRKSGFCGDRTTYGEEYEEYISDNSLGTGQDEVSYGSTVRLYSYKPTLECPDKEHDLYTIEGAKEGTKSLTYPIGLITSDELMYAGSNSDNYENNKYYLYNGETYWTISPNRGRIIFGSFNTYVYQEDKGKIGGVTALRVSNYLRPVINLTANSLIHGTGTSTDPYTI